MDIGLCLTITGGLPVARTERRIPETAVKIGLEVDTAGIGLTAGVNDQVFVYASLLDTHGTLVPVNGHPVRFEVEGDALLVGPNPAPSEAGIAAILLQAGENSKRQFEPLKREAYSMDFSFRNTPYSSWSSV
jgi:beta-galactosidase